MFAVVVHGRKGFQNRRSSARSPSARLKGFQKIVVKIIVLSSIVVNLAEISKDYVLLQR